MSVLTADGVKDLNEDDMMIYSIPKYEKDDSSLSEKDCYIYGVILGDGSLSNDKDYGYISLNHTTKQHILEKCEEYFPTKVACSPLRSSASDALPVQPSR